MFKSGLYLQSKLLARPSITHQLPVNRVTDKAGAVVVLFGEHLFKDAYRRHQQHCKLLAGFVPPFARISKPTPSLTRQGD